MGLDPAALRAPARSSPSVGRAAAWLRREAGPVSLFCVATAFTFLLLPHQLLLDGWLTLVSGREVVLDGLPAVDTMTAWTSGVRWIDQQWLAQAFFYVLWSLGGIKLVMLGNAAIVASSLALGLFAARRLGGSPGNVARAGLAAALVAPWAIQMRTQTLVMPLFVLLLWILASDSRTPSRRVYAVFPLLVLWANLHGTVLLAAALVTLRGLTSFVSTPPGGRRPPRPRRLALVLGPAPCVLASPYGLELLDYYRRLMFNPELREIAPEWGVSTPSVWTAVFYAVAAFTFWRLRRRAKSLTLFELGALVSLTAAGAMAVRSLMWFAFAVLLFLPLLLGERGRPGAPRRRLGLGTAAALATSLLWAGMAVAQPASWYTSSWPDAAAERVARAAQARPHAVVFSDGRFSSWLIWLHPELAGRISHDVRWELYTPAQLKRLLEIDYQAGSWRRTVAAHDILVLDTQTHLPVVQAFSADGRYERVWRDKRVAVFVRR